MATTVWFLPGFMGSTLGLYRASGGQKTGAPRLVSLWGEVGSIPALPLLSVLALPSPLGPSQVIVADGLVPTEIFGGYTRFALSLAQNLPGGWQYASWPYDWRLSLRTTGAQLALALQTNYQAGNQNILVGHSMGALLAWAAWATLVDQQQTAALQRIITFGGCLYGAGATPGVFLENETSLGQLALLQNLVIGNTGGAFANLLRGPTDAQVAALLATAATWPGLYDLYPDPAGLDDPGDTQRSLVGANVMWGSALVPPNWTVYNLENTTFHQWLRTAAHVPGGSMCVNIVGAGFATPYRVQVPPTASPPASALASATLARRWLLPSWSTTSAGDGRCTVAQQAWPGRRVTYIGSQHAAQQMDPATLLAVVAFLQAPIIPPTPVSGAAYPSTAPTPTYPAPTFKPTDLLTPAQLVQLAPSVPPVNLLTGIYAPDPETAAPPPVIPVHVGVDP